MARQAHKQCDECGRAMAKATRIENGYAYCATCYKGVFPLQVCTRCEGPTRAHCLMVSPVCSACKRKSRHCLRCEKSLPRAAKTLQHGAVCASCVPYVCEARECAQCGRLSQRLSRAPKLGIFEPVCSTCRSIGYKTCKLCRRFRKTHCFDQDGRSLCEACGGEVSATYPCPSCGRTTFGKGTASCYDCSIRVTVERRLALNREMLEQEWVRLLYEEFCRSSYFPSITGGSTRKLDRYATFFAAIDSRFSRAEEITQERLVALVGAEGLRRVFLVVSFFIDRWNLPWSKTVLQRLAEETKIQRILRDGKAEPWRSELEEYHTFLLRKTAHALKVRTIRQYLTAATSLYQEREKQPNKAFTQDTLSRYLRKSPGQAANLSPLCRYLQKTQGLTLLLPIRARPEPIREEKFLVRQVRKLVHRLKHMENPLEARSVLSALIAKLHGIPLEKVLTLSMTDVQFGAEGIRLWPQGLNIPLHPKIEDAFRRWLLPATSLLFVGSNRRQSLSAAAVRYHLRQSSTTYRKENQRLEAPSAPTY